MGDFASKGVANAGLTTGIIGTALGLLNGNNNNCGGGLLGGILGGNNNHCENYVTQKEMTLAQQLDVAIAQNAKLEAERYTDQVGLQVFEKTIAMSNANDAKINANYKELAQGITNSLVSEAKQQAEIACLAEKVSDIRGTVKELSSEVCDLKAREVGTQKDISALANLTNTRLHTLQSETKSAIESLAINTQTSINCLRNDVWNTFVPAKKFISIKDVCPRPASLCKDEAA